MSCPLWNNASKSTFRRIFCIQSQSEAHRSPPIDKWTVALQTRPSKINILNVIWDFVPQPAASNKQVVTSKKAIFNALAQISFTITIWANYDCNSLITSPASGPQIAEPNICYFCSAKNPNPCKILTIFWNQGQKCNKNAH